MHCSSLIISTPFPQGLRNPAHRLKQIGMESESLDLPATEESGSPNHRGIRRQQSRRAPGIREQPRLEADKDRSGLRKFTPI
jgi:hypothetical protein